MTRYRFALICVAVAAVTTAAVVHSTAQPPAPATGLLVDPKGPPENQPLFSGLLTRPSEEEIELHKTRLRADAALKSYRGAETDEQRTAAENELQVAVAEQFDVMMKSREAQIEELKARLDKLTEQLQKRRDAKEQIVKLRVQVLVNEAQGLGFYPEGTSEWPAMEYGMGDTRLLSPVPVRGPTYPGGTTPPRQSR